MEKPVKNIMGYIRRTYGLPKCTKRGIMGCDDLRKTKVNGTDVFFCIAEKQCK